MDAFLEKIRSLDGLTILVDYPLSKACSWHTGGKADAFVQVDTFHALKELLRAQAEFGVPHIIVGKGTNILYSDDGFRGTVLRLGKEFQKIAVSGDHIVAGSAAMLANVVRIAEESGLAGLEFASGVPGTFGGALAGNAGAYGIDILSLVTTVHILDENLEMASVPRESIEHGYRNSDLMARGVILEAELQLTKFDKEIIRKDMDAYFEKRRANQPYDKFTAGSVFKNPVGLSAGKLIEEAGLKGHSIGGARISPLHANFIENTGDATSDDIFKLIIHTQRIIREKTGTTLEPEVRFIGKFESNSNTNTTD